MMSISLKLADNMIEPHVVFEYFIPIVFSSQVCDYADTNYIDIENGEYRRNLDEGLNRYIVCKNEGTKYNDWMDPRKITYVVDNQRSDI